MLCNSMLEFLDDTLTLREMSGAPIENIVQNHLNIALLNVFFFFFFDRVDIGIFLSPKNFSSVRDFLAESLVIRKS